MLHSLLGVLLSGTKVMLFLKEHSAYVAGLGFAVLALSDYAAGDNSGASRNLMLALTAVGLKSSIEKVWNGLPETPNPPPPTSPK